MSLKSLVVAASALLLAACDSNPTSPSPGDGGSGASVGDSIPYVYTVTLLPGDEVPPVTNADASGSGTAVITLNLTTSSTGTVASATADFQVSLTDFPAGTSLTGAHIHEGAFGANGSVRVSLGLSAGEITLPGGSASFSRTGISVDPALAQAIVNNPAGYYFNVHTLINPGGAVRGQL